MGYGNMMNKTPVIQVKNLSKAFISNGEKLNVLSNINLDIYSGDFVTILGVSGSGKSTFLRCIGGFEQVDSGEVFINGEKVTKPGRYASMVFQDFNQIFPWKTVYENVSYPLTVLNTLSENEIKEKTEYYLNMVGLNKFHDYYPHQLSGGMKQRTAIARSLAQEPSVILMDEPFASLDADTRTALRREVLDIWYKADGKITILFVTHGLLEAISIASRFFVLDMKKGYSVFDNPVEGVAGKLKNPEDKGFDECWSKLNNMIRNER